MVRKIVRFFDKLEDHVRNALSHTPIVYAFFGGVGVVLFWRGVWHTADVFLGDGVLNGPISFLLGAVLLLMTGLFVSIMIGDQVIISGLRGEKKVAEKAEEEIELDSDYLVHIKADLHRIARHIATIEEREGITHDGKGTHRVIDTKAPRDKR